MTPTRRHRRGARVVAGLLAVQLSAAASAAFLLQPAAVSTATVAARVPTQVRAARVDPEGRTTAVRRLLAARARAVLRHDRRAFLATVDPQSGGFLARQASLVDALRDVPVASWEYVLDPTREQPQTPALDAEHGTWWAPEVSLRYALSGFDRVPTLQPQGLTFVQRAGRWYVGADDDFARTSRRTARELWDGGRVVVARGASCLVMGHSRHQELVQQLVGECDAAVPRVTAVWGRGWAQRVVVLVPDTAAELDRLVPEAGDLSQIAALATAELVEPASGYHPVGDRVLVNPTTFTQLGSLGRRVVVAHEVTHVASRAATGPAVPTWLVEGLADYVGYLGSGVAVRVAAEELRADIRAGRVPRELPRDAAFGGDRKDLPQTYEQSWLAVRLLVERNGLAGMLALYRSAEADSGAGGYTRALRDELGLTERAFTRAWRDDLVRQLR